jgi:hypothetical protein
MLAMEEYGEDERFTWFGPPERNTLRRRENESCIAVCYSSIGLALGCIGFSPHILTSTAAFYNIRLQW